jgi:hypothetical protein
MEDQTREEEAVFFVPQTNPARRFRAQKQSAQEKPSPLVDAIADYDRAKAPTCEQGHISQPRLDRTGRDLPML